MLLQDRVDGEEPNGNDGVDLNTTSWDLSEPNEDRSKNICPKHKFLVLLFLQVSLFPKTDTKCILL